MVKDIAALLPAAAVAIAIAVATKLLFKHQQKLKKAPTLIQRWSEKYGDAFTIKLDTLWLVLSDPKDIKLIHACKPVDHYTVLQAVLDMRPGTFDRAKPLCRLFIQGGFGGVVAQNGETWKRHRRITSSAFRHVPLRVCAHDNLQPMTAKRTVHSSTVIAASDTSAVCWLVNAGAVEAAHDIQVMVKTLAYRILAQLPVWKLLPDRQFNAATKRFDALITGLIAQEKARLAAAGITDTSTATGTDADKVTDTSGVKGSCLLTQLVQYGAATKAAGAATTADKDSEKSRYALTSKEAQTPLVVV
eukprot:1765-Heterococcus_DN1.PRE.3